MNKTVTINISGIIFHIEEDAYDKLSKYLSTIKGYFNKADGGNEIMSDIEARIAEMLQGKTSAIKQVVLMSDVDYVIESMGKPEEFVEAGDINSEPGFETEFMDDHGKPVKKRLYRDGDNKVLGGVCSGIGHYFGFDPVWLRIALLLLLVFAGSGVLIYIILWIAVPEAKTIAEKLAMKGEKADINNISKAVKEEAEHLKKRMEKYGKEFQNMASNNRSAPYNAAERIVYFLLDVFRAIGIFFLKFMAVLMVVVGIIVFLGLIGSVFGISLFTNIDQEWLDMTLFDGKDSYIGLIGIVVFIGAPIVMLIYSGIKLLFNIKYTNRWVNRSASIVWVIGLVMLLYVGIRIGKDFNKVAKIRENVAVIPHDTLVLKMNKLFINYDELQENDVAEEGEKDFSINRGHHSYMIGTHKNTKYLLGSASLNIIKAQTPDMEMVVVKEAKGSTKEVARTRAQNIAYHVTQHNNELLFDNNFRVNGPDKLRGQDVTVILRLPVGKVVYLDKSLRNLIYDIENVSNTYDGDMIDRRWIMTANGLKCVDCAGLDTISYKRMHEEQYEHVTDDNIKIDVNIKVDSNGVKIRSKDRR